ncbi:MAG TPA: glycosyltransferase family 39 protein [Roseiflexaceae bacterium]|nr:glycosyltransferase family 39 protein [Roseiflexaceae bacterium]
MTRSNILIAMVLGLLTVAALVASAPQIGLTWDEPAYIAASESYVAWLDRLWHAPGYALSPRGVRAYWDINHEHPPLDKLWSGLVWSLARHAFDDLTAHRLGNILLVGGLVALLYLTVAASFGQRAGLAAAAALVTLPRFFFHAHLAALDVPAAVAVFGVTALFWHTRGRPGLGWDLLLGAAWGAALALKINAVFVLPTLLLWLLLFDRRPRLVGRLLVAGLVGPPLFVALWPWLYHETAARLVAYVRFITVDHWEIGQYYLGEWHMPPPWHFPFVMLVAVTPTALLVLAALGVVRAANERRTTDDQSAERAAGLKRARQTGVAEAFVVGRSSLVFLWALSAAVPLLALAIGQTKVYDNERLFMPVFPFLAALAGVGLDWAIGGVARTAHGRRLRFALPALLFAPHLLVSAALYPHLLSYYAEGVGGLPGARRLGLETTYWCEVYAEALPYINANAPPGAVVWVEDWSHDVLHYYQLQGRLRKDLRIAWAEGAGSVLAGKGAEGQRADIDEADVAIVAYRETGLAIHPEILRWTAGRRPVLRVERLGVPLVEVYRRDAEMSAATHASAPERER